MSATDPSFFASPGLFGQWLAEHHETADHLWVGFWRKGSGLPSMTWPESVDEALCHGWIDGLRRGLDDKSYVIRFSPRRPSSVWSAVNLRRMEALIAEGRVKAAGLRAYEARHGSRKLGYTYSNEPIALTEEYEAAIKADEAAWAFFSSRAPSYQRLAAKWVMTAKREETRRTRLATLIELSREGRRMPYT